MGKLNWQSFVGVGNPHMNFPTTKNFLLEILGSWKIWTDLQTPVIAYDAGANFKVVVFWVDFQVCADIPWYAVS